MDEPIASQRRSATKSFKHAIVGIFHITFLQLLLDIIGEQIDTNRLTVIE